ncbi:MAG: hypothetical protein U0744_01850 [Gemmataceae bacterium]
MIREALDAGVSKPAAITVWVQEKYQTEVKKSLISNVKQRYKSGRGKGGKKRGRPAKNGNVAPAAVAPATVAANGEGKSQSDLIRLALEGGVLKPAHIIAWVKQTYGKDVGRGLVNQVKHKWIKDGGRKRSGPRIEKPTAGVVRPISGGTSHKTHGGVNIEDIISVKNLLGRLGKTSLTKLIEVL